MGKKTKIGYLTLGLGIGIIFSSTLYSFQSQIKYIDLTDDIIIEKARELGMVSLKKSIQVDTLKKEELDEKESELEDILIKEKESKKEEEKEELVEEVEVEQIVVESGSSLTSVATKLYNMRLIEDKEEFILYVKEKQLDKRIITGKYEIKYNSSYEEIIKILTWRPK